MRKLGPAEYGLGGVPDLTDLALAGGRGAEPGDTRPSGPSQPSPGHPAQAGPAQPVRPALQVHALSTYCLRYEGRG